MIGNKYGKLEVVAELPSRKMPSGIKKIVRVRCECGTEKETQIGNLTSGRSTQCKSCANRSRRSKGQRADDLVNRFQCYKAYERAAIRRGFSFNLTAEEFYKITAGDCEYCCAPPSNVFNLKYKGTQESRGGTPFIYNGIDRSDSSLGYSLDNCVPSCRRCNLAKNDMTVAEFREWLKAAYKHTIGD